MNITNIPIILWIFLFLLIIIDEITTFIGINKGLNEKNELYKSNPILNFMIKFVAIILIGLIIFYLHTVVNNIILIRGV